MPDVVVFRGTSIVPTLILLLVATGSRTFACSAGEFPNGQNDCTACYAGAYCNGYSVFSCPAGTANPFLGGESISACIACPAGAYSSSGATECSNCAAGTFSYVTGSGITSLSGCTACPAGTYSTTPVSSACASCPEGTSNPSTGGRSSSACNLCLPGTYSAQRGAISCTACPLGTFSGQPSSAACTKCAAGSYAIVTGRSACVVCPIGSYCPSASSPPIVCRRSVYCSHMGQTYPSFTLSPDHTLSDGPFTASSTLSPSLMRSVTKTLHPTLSGPSTTDTASRSSSASQASTLSLPSVTESRSVCSITEEGSISPTLPPSTSVTLSGSPSLRPSATRNTTSISVSTSSTGTPSRSSTVTIDPCNMTFFNTSSELVSAVYTTVGGIRTSTEVAVNSSVVVTISSTTFRAARGFVARVMFAVELRNFKGEVSSAWFPWPRSENCILTTMNATNMTSVDLHLSYDADSTQFRLSSEDYDCRVVVSSDAFQCQQLTRFRFNFTLSAHVVGVTQLPWWVRLVTQIASLFVSTFLGGQSLLQQSRTNRLQQLASCEYSLVDDPDVLSHPLQFGFGSSPQYYRRGLVVGDTSIIGAIPLLAFVVAAVACRGHVGALERVVVWGVPSIIFFVVTSLLLDSVMEAGVSLLAVRWSGATDVAVGSAGVALCASILIGLVMVLAVRLRERVRFVLYATDVPVVKGKRPLPGSLSVLIKPQGHLEVVNNCDDTAKTLIHALEPVHGEHRVLWFGCVEYALTLAISGLVGTPRLTTERCEALAAIMLALYVVYVLTLTALRPQRTHLGNFVAIVGETLCLVNCMLLYVSISRSDQSLADAMRFFSMASYMVMWLQVVPAAVAAVRVLRGPLSSMWWRVRQLLCCAVDEVTWADESLQEMEIQDASINLYPSSQDVLASWDEEFVDDVLESDEIIVSAKNDLSSEFYNDNCTNDIYPDGSVVAGSSPLNNDPGLLVDEAALRHFLPTETELCEAADTEDEGGALQLLMRDISAPPPMKQQQSNHKRRKISMKASRK